MGTCTMCQVLLNSLYMWQNRNNMSFLCAYWPSPHSLLASVFRTIAPCRSGCIALQVYKSGEMDTGLEWGQERVEDKAARFCGLNLGVELNIMKRKVLSSYGI